MGRIHDLVERQSADLDKLDDRHARLVLRALEDARRELLDRLLTVAPAGTTATTQHLRVMLAQVEAGVQGLKGRMGEALDVATREQSAKALDNLKAIVDAHESTFQDAGAELEVGILRRLADEQGLALHRYSVDKYGAVVADRVQAELASGYAQGLTVDELAKRVAGVDGVIARHAGRAELITRMELARVYNDSHQGALDEVAAYDDPDDPDPMYKLATEVRDKRNHPFSPLLDQHAVLPRQEWEIPVKDAGQGLVWQITDGIAHGFGYPAHYHDRGRQVPHRKSWGDVGVTYPIEKKGKSLFEADVTVGAKAAMRRIDEGTPPEAAGFAGAERSAAEKAGWLDGSGRLTPRGAAGVFPDRLLPTYSAGKAPPIEGVHDIAGRKPTEQSVIDELAAGRALQAKGYALRWWPKREQTPTPDLLVIDQRPPVTERRLDVTRTGNPVTLFTRTRTKAAKGQADYFVVCCDRDRLDILRAHIRKAWPPGAKQLWFLVDGELIPGIG